MFNAVALREPFPAGPRWRRCPRSRATRPPARCPPSRARGTLRTVWDLPDRLVLRSREADPLHTSGVVALTDQVEDFVGSPTERFRQAREAFVQLAKDRLVTLQVFAPRAQDRIIEFHADHRPSSRKREGARAPPGSVARSVQGSCDRPGCGLRIKTFGRSLDALDRLPATRVDSEAGCFVGDWG